MPELTPAERAVLDILAPEMHGARCPVFEWGHETTPTDDEMLKLARDLVQAVREAGPDA